MRHLFLNNTIEPFEFGVGLCSTLLNLKQSPK